MKQAILSIILGLAALYPEWRRPLLYAALLLATVALGSWRAGLVHQDAADLPGGQIEVTGKFAFVPQPQTFEGAITGGTGAYRNATGYIVEQQLNAKVSRLTLYLTD